MRVSHRFKFQVAALAVLVGGCGGKSVSADVTLAMGKYAGDLQVLPPSTTVSVLPAVRILDDKYQPVEGVKVIFTVTAGGGTISGTSATTNSDGVARVGSWTMGAVAGTNTLTAASPGVTGSPLTFMANATLPGDPKGGGGNN